MGGIVLSVGIMMYGDIFFGLRVSQVRKMGNHLFNNVFHNFAHTLLVYHLLLVATCILLPDLRTIFSSCSRLDMVNEWMFEATWE